MSQAESLDAARRYLFEAVNGLDGATRALDRVGLIGTSEQVRDLHKGAEELHFEVRLASEIAHRAENPDAYDQLGRWIGRRHERGQN